MLFTSLSFLIFLPLCVFAFYSISDKYRGHALLTSSAIFYSWINPINLLFLVKVIIVNYLFSLQIYKTKIYERKKHLLIISLLLNFSSLLIVKYYSFITENLGAILSIGGASNPFPEFSFIIPLGLSFFSFQASGYTIDVYLGKIKPEKSIIIFANYISFFPQLIAGPIERAKRLIPQIKRPEHLTYENLSTGFRLILWGVFKKIVIADRLAVVVNIVYGDVEKFSGTTLLIATVFFIFQIYCDFSAYTDIARGAARLFGISLIKNFNYPYKSKSITEYWKRWHISLTSWLTDYIYIPIALNKRSLGIFGIIQSMIVTFLISGLWHGAGWTFIIWGFIHGLVLSVEVAFKKLLSGAEFLPNIFKYFYVFSILILSNIFFRALNVGDAFTIIRKIILDIPAFITVLFSDGIITSWSYIKGTGIGMSSEEIIWSIFLIFGLESVQGLYRLDRFKSFYFNNTILRILSYFLILFLILFFGVFDEQNFIYFQF
tara:strand:+ start:150 stop:1616 length:1467 start_codon:yes stop_codon:yes gene_type:complete